MDNNTDDTKLCPFCKEIIKKNAIKCRYCGESLIETNTANTLPMMSIFKSYMLKIYPKYVLVSETKDSLSYTYNKPATSPGCFIAFILLCMFILPGIIYLFVGGEKAKTYSIQIQFKDNDFDINGNSPDLYSIKFGFRNFFEAKKI